MAAQFRRSGRRRITQSVALILVCWTLPPCSWSLERKLIISYIQSADASHRPRIGETPRATYSAVTRRASRWVLHLARQSESCVLDVEDCLLKKIREKFFLMCS